MADLEKGAAREFSADEVLLLKSIVGPSKEDEIEETGRRDLVERLTKDTGAEKRLLGGLSINEGVDDWYQRLFLCRIFDDEPPSTDQTRERMERDLKLLKGLRSGPQIPCAAMQGGIVSINLEAARQFLEDDFNLPCSVQKISDKGIPFQFRGRDNDDHDGIINEVVATSGSLTAFCDHAISMRPDTLTGDDLEMVEVDPSAMSIDSLQILSMADPRLERSPKHTKDLAEAAERLREVVDRLEEELVYRIAEKPRGVLKDNIEAFTDNLQRRLLRRSGVLFESSLVYAELRALTRTYLENALRDVISYGEHCRFRRLVKVNHVLSAKPLGLTLLGFGGSHGTQRVWARTILSVLMQLHPNSVVDPKALAVLTDMSTYLLDTLLSRAVGARLNQHQSRGNDIAEDDEEWDVDDEERAYAVIDVPVGPKKSEGGYLCKELTARLYLPLDDSLKEQLMLPEPVACITSRDIQAATRLVLPGELAKHAVREGQKAVTKYCINVGDDEPRGWDSPDYAALGSLAGLQLSPEDVAFVSARLTNDFPMSVTAAIYLGAVMEYLMAECLELSGNAASEEGQDAISCRHIHLAVHEGDEELSRVFSRCIVREGGVTPVVPSYGNEFPRPLELEPEAEAATFNAIMMGKARAAAAAQGLPCAVFVDPRTGLHMGVLEDDEGSSCPLPLPVLDALCRETTQERLRLAEAALDGHELALMKAEGYTLRDTEDGDMEGWADEDLCRLYARRMNEVRQEQSTTGHIYPLEAFQRLLREVARDYNTNVDFTAESLEALHIYTEHYLVSLCRDAKMTLCHGRALLKCEDLRLARRMRGERV